MDEQDQPARFDAEIMPHLDAAYNLARWLTRNEHDAQDVVQEAFLRALKFFGGFRGGNSRSWLLTIVRNTAYSWLEKNRKHEPLTLSDEQLSEVEDPAADAAAASIRNADRDAVRKALEELPVGFREVTILRELEGLSYKEIAEITGVPMGTVMSRLARARKELQKCLTARLQPGGRP